jgi:hypothetical protein
MMNFQQILHYENGSVSLKHLSILVDVETQSTSPVDPAHGWLSMLIAPGGDVKPVGLESNTSNQ